jgi:hypothetical protein
MNEVVLEKGYNWIYFKELNQIKRLKDKFINFLIGYWSASAHLYNKGFRKIRWIKLINTKTGVTRIIEEKRFANSGDDEK